MGDAWKCETCKWWGRLPWEHLKRWGNCSRARSWQETNPWAEESKFCLDTYDEEDEGEVLKTRCDFGCVCWEARE